ncbi:MAG: AMP-binding protein [Armatimonadetes bacterium]|nr:AMP-binding protein [Armatimonadota bacterium]
MQENLQAWMLKLERRDDRGLAFGEAFYPYSQIFRFACARASILAGLGVVPGQTAGVVLGTGLELVTTLLGIWLAGAVPVCLPPPGRFAGARQRTRALVRMLRSASCRQVVAEPGVAAWLSEEGLEIPALELPSRGEGGPCRRFPDPDPDEVALIQFSSGTTREPAPIALTHRNVRSNLESILQMLPGGPDRHGCVSWLPFHHDMGLIGSFLCSIAGQANLTLLSPQEFAFRPARWLQALSRTRATISSAPNFALAACLERIRDHDLEGLDLSAWEIALVGAEPVQLATLDRFSERFAPCGFRREALTPVYGLAEATLAVTFSAFGQGPRAQRIDPETGAVPGSRALVSVGRPLPGVQVEVRRRGRPVPEGLAGSVHVRGASVMKGYLGLPERTRAVLRDGWLDTGDRGLWHCGELYLCGRNKDLLIVQGRNHDPGAVEEAVVGLGVLRSAAFSAEDETRGTESLYLLVEQSRIDGTAPDLARRARDAVIRATGLVPEAVHILEPGALPCTTSGKVRRSAARQQFFQGRLIPVGSSFRDGK